MRTIVTVVATSVLSSLVTTAMVLTWAGRAPAAPTVQAASIEHDGGLALLLERVSAQLDRDELESPRELAPRTAAAERAEPNEPSEPTSDQERLEQLLERVARELADRRVRVAQPVGSPPPLPRDLAVNVAAITDQVAFFAADPEVAGRALRLLTPTEVLERFGAPTRVEGTNVNDYDMWWCWDDPHHGALEMQFKGGYVLYACARPDQD